MKTEAFPARARDGSRPARERANRAAHARAGSLAPGRKRLIGSGADGPCTSRRANGTALGLRRSIMGCGSGRRMGAIGRLRVGLSCAGALLAGACAMPPRGAPATDPDEGWSALHVGRDAPVQEAHEPTAAEKEELAKK